MAYLDEIRAGLASIAPGYQEPIHGFPQNQPAWVMRSDAQTSGVFFCLPHEAHSVVVFEEFANIRLKTFQHHVQGELRNCLLLHCLDHTQREKFALVCADFLDPVRRDFVSSNPSDWWTEWSNLMGNSSGDQSPHAILGELLVWRRMFQINQSMRWSGPDSSSHDLVGTEFDVEVKSTIKRYGKMVTISGEHQLSIAKGKKLFLAFMRFENSLVDECIDSTKAQLVRLGAKDSDIEGRLEKMGYQQGRSTRKKGYLLQEAEIYEITNEFPKITPASFVEGVTPPGIEQIRYEIDLLLIKPYSTLDSFSP